MDAVTMSFLILVAVFALRGAMLGFINLFARIISLIAAYIIAYAFRADAAGLLATQMPNVSPYVLQVIGSVGLFFITALVVGLVIKLLVGLLRKSNKALDALLAGKSLPGRVVGALCNGAIGAFIFLIGLWGYGYASSLAGLPPVPSSAGQLQHAANKVGDTVFGYLLAASKSGKPQQLINTVREQKPGAVETYKQTKALLDGEALQQPLPVRQVEEIVEPTTLVDLLNNPVVQQQVLPKLQELVNNPDVIRQSIEEKAPLLAKLIDSGAITVTSSNPEGSAKAMEQIKTLLNNPEQLQKALSDPRVQQMMEQLSQ